MLVIDVETTGLDPEKDRIVEIGWCNQTTEDCSLVNPGIPIPPEASAVHHITDSMVADAPLLDHVIILLPVDRIFVAHNSRFEEQFLTPQVLGRTVQWIDTYRCVIRAWPDAPKHSNQVLRYWLSLNPDFPDHPHPLHPHRALYDAVTTSSILNRLLERHDQSTLLEWSSVPALLPRVGFGKHFGERWEDVPKSYLEWIIGNGGFDEDVVYTARHWHGQ